MFKKKNMKNYDCFVSQVAAQAGNEVTLVEVNDAALQTGLGRIKTSLQRLTKKLSKVCLVWSRQNWELII